MKILLVNSMFRMTDLHFPIGMGYVAAACRQVGHEAEILDLNFYLHPFEDIVKRIRESRCQVIGIGGMITGYNYAKNLAIAIAGIFPQIPIIAGGSVVLGVEQIFLENSAADIVVVGEGERAVPEILTRMENHQGLQGIPGILFKDGYSIIKNPSGTAIDDLDALASPAWDLFDMPRYLHPYSIYFGEERATDIIASRGCPFGCKFCSHAMGRKVRYRSPVKVVDEMFELHGRYHIRGFVFCDETFSLNKQWAQEICEEMLRRKLDLRWVCYSRVDSVDEEILKLMQKAGCVGVSFGFESGSQKMLDLMGKGTTVEQGRKAVEVTRKIQLMAGGNFILGYPGETPETINETIAFLTDSPPNIYGIHYPLPLPGSELWNYSLKNGYIKNIDEYLSNIAADFSHKPHINFTGMSSEELLAARERIPRFKDVKKS